MARRRSHEDEGAGEEESSRPAAFAPDPNDPTKTIKVGPQEVDMTGFEGEYYKKDEPAGSPPYALRKLKGKAAAEATYGHTHTLKNQERTWTGNKDQFDAQFSETAPEPEEEETESEGEPPAV